MDKNLKKVLFGVVIALSLILFLIIVSSGSNQIDSNLKSQEKKSEIKAEKIEVVHFHATQQCWSCVTIGKYALKTIKERFPKEYANGVITFKDANGDLPENRDLVIKYQAGGSSLFINAITNDQDHIEEDINVWRLVNNEQRFVDYFENKLNNLLN